MRTNRELITELLNKRGIVTEEDINEYLSEKPKLTYDPFLLHDMKAGVDLLLDNINKGKRICIYGDYDADGVTSVCILMSALKLLTDNVFYYIPSRFTEGYGLNSKAIDKVEENGAELIVTVDCGSVSYDEVEYAKAKGLEVIVTDHHTIDDVMADCILINPKHPDSQYPFSELAGCGVAFKMVQAIQRTAGLPRSILNEVLDLVAIGTVGDIVSLTDENRTLVKYGLNRINNFRRPQLKCMAERISLDTIRSENIAFGIVPQINAAGRMNTARDAAELFLAEDSSRIQEGVDKLYEYNQRRKSYQEDAFNRALDHINGDESFIMLNLQDVHEGIAGIVAGKIKEQFNRPAVLVTETEDGFLKGTGRSIDGVNLYEVLSKCSGLFEKFGGHKGACGFLIKKENYGELKEKTLSYVDAMLLEDPDLFDKKSRYDMEIIPDEINVGFAKTLLVMEPFGEGNPSPGFLMRDVRLYNANFMGDNKKHARFIASCGRDGVNCVLFGKAREHEEILFSGRPVNLIGRIGYQVWRGQERVQFFVEEISYADQ